MSDIPDYIVLKRHRDLEGLRKRPWPRDLILAAIALFSLLGLLNVFGQRPETSTASAPAASLELYCADEAARRAALLRALPHHRAPRREERDAGPRPGLGRGHGDQHDRAEPGRRRRSTDGKLTFELGHIPAGQSYILWMQFQVEPDERHLAPAGGRDLRDGPRTLGRIDRTSTSIP